MIQHHCTRQIYTAGSLLYSTLYQVVLYCRFSLVQHIVPGSSILQVLPCTAHCTRQFYTAGSPLYSTLYQGVLLQVLPCTANCTRQFYIADSPLYSTLYGTRQFYIAGFPLYSTLYQVVLYCRCSLVQHTVPGSSILQILPCTAHCTRQFYIADSPLYSTLYQLVRYCRCSIVQHTVPGCSILQVLPCTAHCTRVFYCRFSLVTSEGERKEGDTCLVDISGPMCFQVHMLTIPVWGEILNSYYLQKARKLQIQIFLVKLFL